MKRIYIIACVALFALAVFLVWWFGFRDGGGDVEHTVATSKPPVTRNTTGTYRFVIGAFTNAGSGQSYVDWTNVDEVTVVSMESNIFNPVIPYSVGNMHLSLGTTGKELTGTFHIGFEGILNVGDYYAEPINLGIYVGGTESSHAHFKQVGYTAVSYSYPLKRIFDGTLTVYDTLTTIPAGTEIYLTLEDPNGYNISFSSISTTSAFTISVT